MWHPPPLWFEDKARGRYTTEKKRRARAARAEAGLNKVVSNVKENMQRKRTYGLRVVGGLHPAIPERAASGRALALLPGGIGGAGHPPALVLTIVI